MEELFGIIALIVSIIMIYTFFSMSTRLSQIRDGITHLINTMTSQEKTVGYWIDRYKAARMKGNNAEMIESLQMFVYYKVKQVPFHDRKTELKALAEKYQTIFSELDTAFPVWDDKVFK